MKAYIESRAIEIAKYTINTKSTVRQTARKFCIGKTTVFRDLTIILPQIDSILAQKAAEVLKINLHDRHNRGGAATKVRYAGR